MVKHVGIITFHAAHNYGSSLQAYALSNIISQLGCSCEIINFRTLRQRDQYAPFTKRIGWKYLLKNGYFLLHYKARKQKYDRFESFLEDYLVKSKREYTSLQELSDHPPQYDYYVSGSDQIWNTIPVDADDAYFLPFVKEGKRIAYAPSFGQLGMIQREDDLQHYIKVFDVLSAREKQGQEILFRMTGREVPVLPDPTMLYSGQEWEKMVPPKIISGEYLFFILYLRHRK